MMKQVTLNVSEEELLLLVGILRYSEGEILTNTYSQLVNELDSDQLSKAIQIATSIAITANGYYINEEDLIYEALRKGGN